MACAECDGTGQAILMNSWFIADGYRRQQCGLCDGTGKGSSVGGRYGIPGFRKTALARIEKWGGMRPHTQPLYAALEAFRRTPNTRTAAAAISIAEALCAIEGLSAIDLSMVRRECGPAALAELRSA